MKSGIRVTVCVLPLLVAACSVGPDYGRPETEAPKAWDGNSAGSAEAVDLEWWKRFRDDDLDRLIVEAEGGSFDLRLAVARLKQANAQAEIAGAPLLPSLDAVGQAERIRQRPGDKKGVNSYLLGLRASYELDFWGLLADQAEAAELLARASAFDRQTAELSLQSSVADSYFALLSLNERVRAAEENVRAAEKVLDAYRARFQVGAASALDLAQQENVADEQRAFLPPLLESRRQMRDALALLLGKTPEGLAEPAGTLDRLSLPAVSPGLPSELLARRPDVQSAEASLQSASRTVKASIAAVFPQITLTAEGGGASATLSNLFKPQGAFYQLIGGLAQPIFRGGVLEGGKALAEGQYEEKLATYQKTVASAFADVENALAAVEFEDRREAAQRAAAGSARRAYEISQAQLYSGTVDILTVLNTQRSLFTAEDALAQARLSHAQAVVALFKALGGGWQAPVEF